MVKKVLILFFSFYFLTLLQMSFFVHFFSFLPNFVLITLILINLLESQKSNLGIISALFGGFFLDIFSENFIGFYILISCSISLFIKYVLKTYVKPVFKLKL